MSFKPRKCVCTSENDYCNADNDLMQCYRCKRRGYEFEIPRDSLAPMGTCHACPPDQNQKHRWICDDCRIDVWMPEYPRIPVCICHECYVKIKYPLLKYNPISPYLSK